MEYKSNKKNISLPWVEKYRPTSTDDILLDDNVKNKITSILNNKIITNLIFTGEPGTGKTSTILCLINQLYSDIEIERNILELNASDDRGLNIINTTIIPFCKKINYKNKLKIIILDEADSLTLKAQNLLTTLINNYNKTTRFVFICNEYNKIIESIQSSCNIILFHNLNNNFLKTKIKTICEKENIDHDVDSFDDLIFVSNNNIREVINNMECIYMCYKKLNKTTIYDVINKPKPYYIRKILEYCCDGNLEQSLKTLNELYENGYSPNDILQTFMKFILEDDFKFDKLTKETKMK